MIGVHNSQPQDNGLRNRLPTSIAATTSTSTSSPLVCPPPLAPSARERPRPCPSRPEQLPPAHSACQLAGPSPRQPQLAGRVAGVPWASCLGPSLGWDAQGGGWGRGKKSLHHHRPLPSPGGEGARAESARGPVFGGVGVPSLCSRGAQVAALGHPFSPGKFAGAQPRALPPSRALPAGGSRLPHPPTHPAAPAPSSALPGCTPSSPAPLTPARAWRRRGHSALAEGRGGEAEGERRKRRPGGPRRAWRG